MDKQKSLSLKETTRMDMIELEIKQLKPGLPSEELSKAVNAILSKIAQCDSAVKRDAYLKLLKKASNCTLDVLKKDLATMMEKTKASSQGRYQVVEGSSQLINPSMDFRHGTGYLCVNLKIRDEDTGEVANMPHVVTSKRELILAKNASSFDRYKLYVTSLPAVLSREPLWPHRLLTDYLQGNVTVMPDQLLLRIEAIYEGHLDFQDPNTPLVLALYTMGTYLYRIYESYPYLYIFGQKGSGKTKCLLVAKNLCYNAIMASDISGPATFRTIEASSCTLLIDEAERLKGRNANEDLIRLLNSGYKRGSSAVRVDPETLRVQTFDTYSPKILAGIKGIDNVLADRCITIVMIRTTDSRKANRAVTERGENWSEVRHFLYCFALQHFEGVAESYKEVIGSIEKDSPIIGRTAELWIPLFSIAHYVDSHGSGGFLERAQLFAKQSLMESRENVLDDWSTALLLSLADRIKNNPEQSITLDVSSIKGLMLRYLGASENDLNITNAWIGQELRRFQIGIKKRTRNGFVYTFSYTEIADRIRRYLPATEEDKGV